MTAPGTPSGISEKLIGIAITITRLYTRRTAAVIRSLEPEIRANVGEQHVRGRPDERPGRLIGETERIAVLAGRRRPGDPAEHERVDLARHRRTVSDAMTARAIGTISRHRPTDASRNRGRNPANSHAEMTWTSIDAYEPPTSAHASRASATERDRCDPVGDRAERVDRHAPGEREATLQQRVRDDRQRPQQQPSRHRGRDQGDLAAAEEQPDKRRDDKRAGRQQRAADEQRYERGAGRLLDPVLAADQRRHHPRLGENPRNSCDHRPGRVGRTPPARPGARARDRSRTGAPASAPPDAGELHAANGRASERRRFLDAGVDVAEIAHLCARTGPLARDSGARCGRVRGGVAWRAEANAILAACPATPVSPRPTATHRGTRWRSARSPS